MSYDIYSYRPSSERPNIEEAQAIMDAEEADNSRDDPEAREITRTIATAFRTFNPRLEEFIFDYSEIAKFGKISEQAARAQYNHIELNPPEGDLAIQVEIHWDHVSYGIPYWYTGTKAEQVFAQLLNYLKLAKETVGFFAYDPQADRAFDPTQTVMLDSSQYSQMSKRLPEIVAQQQVASRKPWWKFW